MMNNPRVGDLSVEQMLEVCLEWLLNVNLQDRERYLAAMPNNVPGAAAMSERLASIRATRRAYQEDHVDDDEYQRVSMDRYEQVNSQAASIMLFSERLLADQIRRRGDSAQAARMRSAYARLILMSKQALAAYATEPTESDDEDDDQETGHR